MRGGHHAHHAAAQRVVRLPVGPRWRARRARRRHRHHRRCARGGLRHHFRRIRLSAGLRPHAARRRHFRRALPDCLCSAPLPGPRSRSLCRPLSQPIPVPEAAPSRAQTSMAGMVMRRSLQQTDGSSSEAHQVRPAESYDRALHRLEPPPAPSQVVASDGAGCPAAGSAAASPALHPPAPPPPPSPPSAPMMTTTFFSGSAFPTQTIIAGVLVASPATLGALLVASFAAAAGSSALSSPLLAAVSPALSARLVRSPRLLALAGSLRCAWRKIALYCVSPLAPVKWPAARHYFGRLLLLRLFAAAHSPHCLTQRRRLQRAAVPVHAAGDELQRLGPPLTYGRARWLVCPALLPGCKAEGNTSGIRRQLIVMMVDDMPSFDKNAAAGGVEDGIRSHLLHPPRLVLVVVHHLVHRLRSLRCLLLPFVNNRGKVVVGSITYY